MNLGDLCSTTKTIGAQNRAAGLWSFDELKVYANEAENEAAARARLILDIETATDASNAALCHYSVAKGAYSITLHPKIIFVKRVRVLSLPVPLPRIHFRDLNMLAPEWEDHAEGSVVAYCPNWQKGKLLFYNAFPASDTVRLQVIRRPLVPMIGPTDSPEIEEQHHMGLVNWMLWRAFDKLDPDTMNKAKAAKYLDLFEQQFGKRSSAVDETWIQREHGYDEFEGLF